MECGSDNSPPLGRVQSSRQPLVAVNNTYQVAQPWGYPPRKLQPGAALLKAVAKGTEREVPEKARAPFHRGASGGW